MEYEFLYIKKGIKIFTNGYKIQAKKLVNKGEIVERFMKTVMFHWLSPFKVEGDLRKSPEISKIPFGVYINEDIKTGSIVFERDLSTSQFNAVKDILGEYRLEYSDTK